MDKFHTHTPIDHLMFICCILIKQLENCFMGRKQAFHGNIIQLCFINDSFVVSNNSFKHFDEKHFHQRLIDSHI